MQLGNPIIHLHSKWQVNTQREMFLVGTLRSVQVFGFYFFCCCWVCLFICLLLPLYPFGPIIFQDRKGIFECSTEALRNLEISAARS